MEIVDLRPGPERALAGMSARSGPGNPLVRVADRVAQALTEGRVARRSPPPAGVLVVSVGNLRLGGTGKTPVVAALAGDLARRGLAGAIVTRGYGGAAAGPLVVQADDPRAADEARLLAGRLAGTSWTVIQSRRRERGLAAALDLPTRPQVIVLEDGHQTAHVGRHLDVLILDAWRELDGRLLPLAGATLPFGPYREPAAGADRAGVWLLEAPDGAPALAAEPPQKIVVAGFARDIGLEDVAGRPAPGPDARLGLIAGLARPEGFEAGCVRLLARPPVVAVRCRDHCRYERATMRRILATGVRHGVGCWITTEKDWIKLAAHWPLAMPVQVATLAVRWTGRQALPDLVEERLGALGAGGPEV